MKEKRRPDRTDLEAIRNQILDFACARHDFKLESESFPVDGNWNGVFLVRFRDNPAEDINRVLNIEYRTRNFELRSRGTARCFTAKTVTKH